MSKKVITCPYCFKKFNNTDVEYQCENIETSVDGTEKCPREVDQRFNDHWGNVVMSKHFFKGRPFSLFGNTPKPSKCDKCGHESSRFVCPHCHNWLPTEMIAEGSEIISIVGAPNSGKTVYFFNLMRELERKGYLLGLVVTPQDEGPNRERKTSMIYREMIRRMYDDKLLPEKTPVNVGEKPVPLIFKVTNKKAGKNAGKTIYIVFYDTPGEAFEDVEQISRMADHVSNSAGVILFIDPYNIQRLYSAIRAASDGNAVAGGISDNDNVLNSLLQKVDKAQSVDKPFAIVFSKIDVVLEGLSKEGAEELQNNIDMNSNSSFLRTKRFSLSEIDQISGALEAVSDEWDIGYMRAKIAEKYREENIKMFAVSSLGSQPDGDTVGKIQPYRVMDPLVWILYKMGGFDIPVE